ncbi:MAG: hypothetical protein WC707_04600 [Candidatus Babeliaceae bacterium]|jgi:hypothetical protein
MIVICHRHKVIIFLFFITSIVFFYCISVQKKKATLLFSLDYALSKAAQEKIKNTLTPQVLYQYPAVHVVNMLQQDVPTVDALSWRYNPLGSAYVRVACHKPIVQVSFPDKTYVALSSGQLFFSDYYDAGLVSSLPTIHVAQTELRNIHDLEQFIQGIPRQFFEEYAVVWHNKTHILIVPRDMHCIQVKTTSDLFCYQALAPLIQYFCTKIISDKTKNTYTIDVRFKDYIILSTHKGGVL